MTATSSDRNLGSKFSELFELVPALDDATRDAVYRVRHEVYCRDLGWEPVREDGMETDICDRHSIHLLLRRRDTGEPVGCTRLILTRPEDPAHPLPFEESCRDELDRSLVDPSRLPRNQIGEVSRLAVMSSFRQRKGEASRAVSVGDDDFEARSGQPRFPFIPVSLYLGVAAIARRLDIEYVFVLTEPRLASHFGRIGFDIRTVGAEIEHRGIRAPSMMTASQVLVGLRPMVRPLYDVIDRAVNAAFDAHPQAQQRWRTTG